VLPGEAAFEPALPPVSRLVREFVLEVKAAQNLLVIKTTVGSAQPVAAALDGQDWEEAIGTIAGDDTILMVCSDARGANRLAARIQEMLA
jgi:transcriptional regulator of arginine metabolism